MDNIKYAVFFENANEIPEAAYYGDKNITHAIIPAMV